MTHQEDLVRRLIQMACEQAGGKPVLEVWIAAAPCAELQEGEAHFYWDQLAANTVCHGAKLHVRLVNFVQKCPQCGHIFPSKKQNVPCPRCGAAHTATLMGADCALVEKVVAYEG